MTTTIVFGIVGLAAVLSALCVVQSRNLVHAVMWLALTLLATAALYALLDAPFLSGIQVLTYVGGVVTLMIFGVMITRRQDGSVIAAGSAGKLRGAAAAAVLCGVLLAAVWKTDFTPGARPAPQTTRDLANALLDDDLVAFEVASLLLLAAIVGAVVLVRRRDPESSTGPEAAAARAARGEAANP